MKQVAGNNTHITIPIVEPTKPNTNSILGISNPTNNDIATMTNVNILNFPSGM